MHQEAHFDSPSRNLLVMGRHSLSISLLISVTVGGAVVIMAISSPAHVQYLILANLSLSFNMG